MLYRTRPFDVTAAKPAAAMIKYLRNYYNDNRRSKFLNFVDFRFNDTVSKSNLALSDIP